MFVSSRVCADPARPGPLPPPGAPRPGRGSESRAPGRRPGGRGHYAGRLPLTSGHPAGPSRLRLAQRGPTRSVHGASGAGGHSHAAAA